MGRGILNRSYPKVNVGLENKAKLKFYFPNPDGTGVPDYIRTCPFFENPTVKENRSASLVKYNPIGRTSTLFGYTGAKSRVFNLSFYLTLPLLLQLAQGAPLESSPSVITKEEQKGRFFTDFGSTPKGVNNNKIAQNNFDVQDQTGSFDDYANALWGTFIEVDTPGDPGASPPTRSTHKFTPQGRQLYEMYGNSMGYRGMDATQPNKNYRDAVSLVVYWANLIRCSVLNYAPNPSVGPPIIRFSLGILYQNVPTIATKYSFTVDDKFGYDTITLLPRRFNISLTLEEIRSSGSGDFESSNYVNRDEARGWESIIGRDAASPGSLDPGVWQGNFGGGTR